MKKFIFILFCLLSVSCLKAQEVESVLIKKNNGIYFLGNKPMTETEYLSFILQNCPEAFRSYRNGLKLWTLGLGFLATGGCLITWGAVSVAAPLLEIMFDSPIGVSLIIIGSGFTIASTPLLIVGGIKKNRSHRIYNANCASSKKTAVTFGIGLSGNGIGLAMNF